jgi:hypothetical protein
MSCSNVHVVFFGEMWLWELNGNDADSPFVAYEDRIKENGRYASQH